VVGEKVITKSTLIRLSDWIASGVIVTALSATANAADVFVRADQNGQGVALAAGDACYVVTPLHVVEDAISITVIAADRYETRATLSDDLGPATDIALLRVEGDPKRICQGAKWSTVTNLSGRLEEELKGTLKFRLEDGSRRLIPVDISGYDEDRFISIRPVREADQITKGLSGAVLVVKGVSAGVLLRVDSETSEGVVLRQDYLYAILSDKLNGGLSYPVEIRVSVAFPGTRTLSVGKTAQLRAKAIDQHGKRIKGQQLLWSSAKPEVATVSTTGLVTAVAPGTATITATSTSGEVSGKILIEVELGSIVVRASANPTTTPAGQPVTIIVTALSEQNIPVSGANVIVETAIGGVFQESGQSMLATGRTDVNGRFRTTWRYQGQLVAPWQHSFYVKVSKPGYTEGKGATVLFLQPNVR
jgi:hypothetical protein